MMVTSSSDMLELLLWVEAHSVQLSHVQESHESGQHPAQEPEPHSHWPDAQVGSGEGLGDGDFVDKGPNGSSEEET